MGLYRSIPYFLASVLWAYISFTDIVQGRQCPDAVNRAGNGGSSPLNPIVWRNQPQIHVVNWIPDNLCNNVQECYGTDQVDEKSDHFPQLCPLYVQHGDPIYFVSGATEKDFLNPIAVSQNDFSNCSLITYPYYWKVTTFPKRHSLKVPTKFLFPGDHHFVQVPFLGSPGCEAGFRLRVTVRTQDCTVPSYPNNPCFGNGYCVFIDKNSPAGASQNETCEEKEDDGDQSDPLSRQGLQMFKCKCRVPYKGRYCEDYDACWNHQCQNGGRCHDLRKGINNREYTCTCPLNYIGKHCEFVKSCFEGLCQNGGQCFYDTSKPNHFQCVCQPAFSGNRCEISTGPGPGQQQLTVLTDNLIREQEERDKALRDQDKMVKTIDQMGGENLTRLSYPRIIIAPFLIGGRPGTTPPPSCNAIVDPKAIDCGVCGCPNGGICIREKLTGPNSCFCPPGVSGPSCKSLAGICTYAQPCLNGGTCLERMIAAANGAAASAQSEQDDSDSLMFPAPGENPAPQPTISWSALTATPVIPVGDGTNAQAQLTPSNNGESNANQPYICLCPTGFFGFTCQSNKDEYCPPTDGSGLEGAAAPLAPLEGGAGVVTYDRYDDYAKTPIPTNTYGNGKRPETVRPNRYDERATGYPSVDDSQRDRQPLPDVLPQFRGTGEPTDAVADYRTKESDRRDDQEDGFRRQFEYNKRLMEIQCLNGATSLANDLATAEKYLSENRRLCVCPPKFIGKFCETLMSPEMERAYQDASNRADPNIRKPVVATYPIYPDYYQPVTPNAYTTTTPNFPATVVQPVRDSIYDNDNNNNRDSFNGNGDSSAPAVTPLDDVAVEGDPEDEIGYDSYSTLQPTPTSNPENTQYNGRPQNYETHMTSPANPQIAESAPLAPIKPPSTYGVSMPATGPPTLDLYGDVDYSSSPYNSPYPRPSTTPSPLLYQTITPQPNVPLPRESIVNEQMESLKRLCQNGAAPFYVSEFNNGCLCSPGFYGKYCETAYTPQIQGIQRRPQATAYPPLITRYDKDSIPPTTPLPTYAPWLISSGAGAAFYPSRYYQYNQSQIPATSPYGGMYQGYDNYGAQSGSYSSYQETNLASNNAQVVVENVDQQQQGVVKPIRVELYPYSRPSGSAQYPYPAYSSVQSGQRQPFPGQNPSNMPINPAAIYPYLSNVGKISSNYQNQYQGGSSVQSANQAPPNYQRYQMTPMIVSTTQCANGGTLKTSENSQYPATYYCMCPALYHGPYCESTVNAAPNTYYARTYIYSKRQSEKDQSNSTDGKSKST